MILVLGGAGFVGSHLIPSLSGGVEKVRVAVRSAAAARWVTTLGAAPCWPDVRDLSSLGSAMEGVRAVVNLVTTTRERRRGDFRHVHDLGSQNIIACARQAGVSRIVHIGALAPYAVRANANLPYIYWKNRATQHFLGSGLDTVVLETSIIFGPGDQLLSTTALVVRYLPVVPIGGSRAARTKFQPLHVQDLTTVLQLCLAPGSSHRGLYELAGPDTYTYRELVELINDYLGTKRRIVTTPTMPVRMVLRLLTIATRNWTVPPGFLDLAGVDSVADSAATCQVFGVTPRRLRDSLDYLKAVDWKTHWRSPVSYLKSA